MSIIPTIQATGRRKTATASVRLCEGKGVILVNKKPLEKYFSSSLLIHTVTHPLQLTEELNNHDIHLRIRGGGTTGQAEAARHAIARAMVKHKQEHRAVLKKHKYLTRDSRMVQSKNFGKPKSRKDKPLVKR